TCWSRTTIHRQACRLLGDGAWIANRRHSYTTSGSTSRCRSSFRRTARVVLSTWSVLIESIVSLVSLTDVSSANAAPILGSTHSIDPDTVSARRPETSCSPSETSPAMGRVSVRRLRHYDAMGLLRRVDARLRATESEEHMVTADVIVTSLPPVRVAELTAT